VEPAFRVSWCSFLAMTLDVHPHVLPREPRMVADSDRRELPAVYQAVKRLLRHLQQVTALSNRKELFRIR
jgi:hypothetical protein